MEIRPKMGRIPVLLVMTVAVWLVPQMHTRCLAGQRVRMVGMSVPINGSFPRLASPRTNTRIARVALGSCRKAIKNLMLCKRAKKGEVGARVRARGVTLSKRRRRKTE